MTMSHYFAENMSIQNAVDQMDKLEQIEFYQIVKFLTYSGSCQEEAVCRLQKDLLKDAEYIEEVLIKNGIDVNEIALIKATHIHTK